VTAEYIVVDRAFVRVAGPEAETYLQGQLSQDVVAVRHGLSFLLEPNGKVCTLLRYGRLADGEFLLDTDGPAGEVTVARLRRFLLRTKADVDLVDRVCTRYFDAPRLPQAQVATAWSVPPLPQDVVGDAPEIVPGAVELDALGYERRRILAGVPVVGVDIGPDTIPAEVGAWAVAAAVSFTKGCYTGQELVARIDSRGGNVPRPLRVLQSADGGSLPPTGDVVDETGEVAGRITSAAADVALGPLARRVEPGASVRAADGTLAVVLR
jgi:folate-binding protein YgfZ